MLSKKRKMNEIPSLENKCCSCLEDKTCMPFVLSHSKLELIFKQFCVQKTAPFRGSGASVKLPSLKKNPKNHKANFHHEFVLLEAGWWPWEVACGSRGLSSSEPRAAGASSSGIAPRGAAPSGAAQPPERLPRRHALVLHKQGEPCFPCSHCFGRIHWRAKWAAIWVMICRQLLPLSGLLTRRRLAEEITVLARGWFEGCGSRAERERKGCRGYFPSFLLGQ